MASDYNKRQTNATELLTIPLVILTFIGLPVLGVLLLGSAVHAPTEKPSYTGFVILPLFLGCLGGWAGRLATEPSLMVGGIVLIILSLAGAVGLISTRLI